MAQEVIEVVEREIEVVEIVERGPAGVQGPQGPVGPAGTTDYNELLNKPTLGTAAAADIGTGAGQVAEGNHTHTSFPSLRIDPATGTLGSLVVGQTTSSQTDWVTLDNLVRLKSSTNDYKASLGASALTADRAISLPDKAGTVALTSDFAAPPVIGNTTPAAASFTTLTANNGTVTTSTPALTVAQVLNNAAVAFDLSRLEFSGTGSSNSAYINCINNGSGVFQIRRTGVATGAEFIGSNGFRAIGNGNSGGQVILTSNGYYSFCGSTTSTFGTIDLLLRRDAAGILAQHNLANPQAYRIYNTTDAGLTNFERGFMRWSSNVLQIGTEKGGTGSARALQFQVDGTTRFEIASNGRMEFTPAMGGLTPSIRINGGSNADVLTIQDGGLRIQGNAANFTFGSGTYSAVSNVINNFNNNLGILVRRQGVGTGDFVDFQDSSNASKLRIDKDGNAVLPTSGGVKIGTATNQLLGFYGATPVTQRAQTADLLDSLQELGLVASGSGNTPLNLSGGTLTAGNLVATDNTGAETATFDAQGKLTGNRTYDLPDASGTLALTSQITKTLAVFTATDNQPPATAFATLDTRNSITVLDFDAATDENAVFVGIMPEAASLGSGLIVRLHWMATTATSGNVRWGVQFERSNTDLDADSFDTAVEATAATNGTSGIITTTAITVTTIDGITAGDVFRLKVFRNADDATNDTMTGDAELVACEVRSAA